MRKRGEEEAFAEDGSDAAIVQNGSQVTPSCIFFGVTELPRVASGDSAAWLLQRHLKTTAGEAKYRATRDN